MRVRILAVGQHIADWAQEAVRGYLARFPRSWSVDLKEIRTEASRRTNASEADAA
mgnify:CR=1 FL=1